MLRAHGIQVACVRLRRVVVEQPPTSAGPKPLQQALNQ